MTFQKCIDHIILTLTEVTNIFFLFSYLEKRSPSYCWTNFRLLWSISYLPEAQYGFRANRWTMDKYKRNALNRLWPSAYLLFVDFPKVFDTVNKEPLWNFFPNLKCPYPFVKLVSALYAGMKGSDSLREELLEPFEFGNGTAFLLHIARFFFLVWWFHWFHSKSMDTV